MCVWSRSLWTSWPGVSGCQRIPSSRARSLSCSPAWWGGQWHFQTSATQWERNTTLVMTIIIRVMVEAYRKEGHVLFNDALNTFYLQLYGVRHMVKDHSDSEKGNPLPPHRLLFPINSKGSFICTIPQTG